MGVDVSVTEIAPWQEFSAGNHQIVDLDLETYQNLRADEKQLNRVIAKEEVVYYYIATLWFKLLDVNAKEGDRALTSEEKAIRKAVTDEKFNVPQPVYAMRSEIGNYVNKMSKEMRHQVPDLPNNNSRKLWRVPRRNNKC